ncbi:MAG: hypothetical protein U0Q15_21190 [Kineosporiaceae bacterium]
MTTLQLPDGAFWDWEVLSWSGGTLILAAGTDLTYHHQLEVIFTEVAYVALPSLFHHPTFRPPTAEELRAVADQVGAPAPVVVAFDHDGTDGDGRPLSGLVAADAVEVVPGAVYRYRRETLLPGERHATWLDER